VAKEYGINLRGSGKPVVLRFDPSLGTGQFGKSRIIEPGVIYFGRDALQSDKELAKTLAHELRHQRDYLAGKATSPEGPAYAAQDRIGEYIEGRR
jgi:hypothetical protein